MNFGWVTIFDLTTHFDQELYVKGERFNGEINFSRFSEFRIDSEAEKYRLQIAGRTGQPSFSVASNGTMFSTPGADNDLLDSGACSEYATGRGGDSGSVKVVHFFIYHLLFMIR